MTGNRCRSFRGLETRDCLRAAQHAVRGDALAYRLDDCRATACLVGDSSAETLRLICDNLDALETVVTVGTEPTLMETSWDALETRIKDRLAPYEYPREIEFIDELPQDLNREDPPKIPLQV